MAEISDEAPINNRGALIVAGLAGSIVLSTLVAGIVLAGQGYDTTSPTGVGAYVGRIGAQTQVLDIAPTELGLPLWALTTLQVPLWFGLLVAVWFAGKRTFAGVRHHLGAWFEPSDIPLGLGIGVFSQLVLVPLLYVPIFWVIGEQDVSEAARSITDRADDTIGIVLLCLSVGLAAPIVEELFFRGLVFSTFQSAAGTLAGVVLSSALFGAIHFQLLQFPALFMFGVVAALLVVKQGRLGGAIFAHIGFNVTTVVVLLALA